MWIAIAFIVFFIAYRPDPAADIAKTILGLLYDIAMGFIEFFTRLVS